MKRITAVFIFLLSLWLLGAVPPAAAAGEDGDPAQFAAAADQMEFILPLRTAAAGVNPRFLSEQRQLLLPLAGLDLARPAAFSRWTMTGLPATGSKRWTAVLPGILPSGRPACR